jgi:uncharacterized phage protein gp47/JayE
MAIIQIPTLAQRIAIIRRRILSNNADLATQPGSVINDVHISPLAVSDVQQMAVSYLLGVAESITDLLNLKQDTNTLSLLALAQNLTVDGVLAQISELLDNWADNFDEERKQPTNAVGRVKFGRVDAPSQDITIGAGKVEKSTSGQSYQTTASVTMFAASPVFDPELLLYVVEAPIQAVDAGSAGNAPVDTVTIIESASEGLPFVTNQEPVQDGTDLETDEELGARLLLKWQAVGKLTKAGIKLTALDVTGVKDVYIATPGDPLSTRGSVKTDVYVEGPAPVLVTETFNAFNSPDYPNAIRPSNLPLVSLSSVDSGTAAARLDTTSPRQGSVQSADAIQFSTAPTFPVTIQYIYDQRPSQVQAALGADDASDTNYVDPITPAAAMDTPILAKAATQVLVDYVATVLTLPGFNASAVKSAAQLAVQAFGETYELGESGFVSDLNQVVEEVPGVLRLAGSPTKFARSSQTGVEDVINVQNNEYIVLQTASIF